MNMLKFVVDSYSEDLRLDVYLSENIKDKSRSYIQNLIRSGKASVCGGIKKGSYKLRLNDEIEVEIPENEKLNVEPENIPIDIIYEDSDVIVVNKPQGMVVHPAPGNYTGTLVNALLYHCTDLSGINGILRPGIVHRIDKDTSGILVVAKNDMAHKKLAEQLKEHSMNRIYNALVEGVIKEDTGTIDKPLGRHPNQRIKMAVVKNGRRAVTHYKVLNRYKNNTLIECKLETGRTHQIRVHMAYMGHPIVGDPIYGYSKQKFKLNGQLLHAKKLGFIHPLTNKYMEFDSELPEYFKKVIEIISNM
ncbi:RluA family pseudouridine synthase [Clostridium guangxiense]|uniref:RluA family pseudouridine synthase n=1 Tax=Clostridium guangxiense TaxID=1662055 RepID=UPI001E3A1DF1|nr:RluA family pseudouridine synthase [Clostridium guangxiense]MCD2345186.1 RluA family pseudouridine synthase [Clostridium guangxiense]